MTTYEKNLNFLKEKNPPLYRSILTENPLQEIYLEKMDNQDNYIIQSKEAKCFMHSVYDMENEVRMMFNDVENNVDTIILFGFGNGNALDYIIKNYENIYDIIIIEPSLQIFKTYLESYDFTNFFNHKSKKDLHMSFIVNKDEDSVVELLSSEILNSTNLAMVFHVSYCSIFNSYYNNMMTNLAKKLKVNAGSVVTLSSQWQLWLFNSIKNLKAENILPVEMTIDFFKGMTAVIVSAGPSLNNNIHLVEKLKEKAIIVAVGSAIKILASRGITPHYRVAVDAFPSEKTIFHNIDTKESPLIFGNQLYNEILPEYKGDKIRFILHSDYLGKYIYKKCDILFREFQSGASVANGVLNFLCDVGCKRIIFMGQDFCYTNEGVRAKGLDKDQEEFEKKVWLKKGRYSVVKDIYGEEVYTTHPYLQMKYTMEATVKKYEHIEFYNATEGGLSIEGVENITAKEVIDQKLKEEIDIFIKEETEYKLKDENIKKEYNKKIKQGLSIMKEELSQVNTIQEEMIELLRKLNKLKRRKININRMENEIRYLENIQKRLGRMPIYKEVIALALQADLLSIETNFGYKGSDREKIIESKEKIIINTIIKAKEYIELAYRLIGGYYRNIVIEK